MANKPIVSISGGKISNVGAADVGTVQGSLSVSGRADVAGDMGVGGNLTVTGDIISGGSKNLVVQDPFVDIGLGASGPQNTGFAFSVSQGSEQTDYSAINATTGVITVTDAGGFNVGDIIMVQEDALTGPGVNDGLYYILSTTTGAGTEELEINPAAPAAGAEFLQTVFESDSSDAGRVTTVQLKAIAVVGTNPFPTTDVTIAAGDVVQSIFTGADATYSAFTTGNAYERITPDMASVDLQFAYDNGNTIVTDAAKGDFDVSGTEAISLDSTVSSNFTITGNDASTQTLQLSSVNTDPGGKGNIQMVAGDSVTIGAGENSAFALTAADPNDQTLTISASNGGAGAGNLSLNASNDVSINGINIIGTATTGDATFDSPEGSFLVNAGTQGPGGIPGSVELSSTTDSSFVMTADAVASAVLEITATNVSPDPAALATLDINADDLVTIDAARYVVTGTESSNLRIIADSVATAALQISATNNNADPAALAEIDVIADDLVSIRTPVVGTAGSVTIDTNNFSIDGTLPSNMTITTDDAAKETFLTIKSTNANAAQAGSVTVQADEDGQVDLTLGGQERLIVYGDATNVDYPFVVQTTGGAVLNPAGGLTFDLNGSSYDVVINDISNDIASSIQAQTEDTDGVNVRAVIDYVANNGYANYGNLMTLTVINDAQNNGITAGQVVAMSGGNAVRADADAETAVLGIALNDAAATEEVQIAQVGQLAGFSGLVAGNELFLSITNTGSNLTTVGDPNFPTLPGSTIYRIGYAKSATEIVIAPQFIAEIV